MYLGLTRRVPLPSEIFNGAPDDALLLERERFALEKLVRFEAGHVAAEPSRPKSCAKCDSRELCRRPLSAPLQDEDTEE
jgi:hypothetical protein